MVLDANEGIRQLANATRNRTLIPFCGAGVSRGAGLPTARELLKKYGLEELPWKQATTIIKNDPIFKQEFKEIFGNRNLSPSEQHRFLASLDAHFYVTTNYDALLESALKDLFGQSNIPTVGVLKNLKGISDIYTFRNLVIKLHGDADDTELMIFDGREYMARWKSPTLVDSFVAHLFATHTILFVGYSLNDEHIVEDLFECLDNPSASLPPKFIIVEDITPSKEKFFHQANIRPILLENEKEDFDDAICAFLYRLWETKGSSGIYTKLVEKEKYPPDKRLKLAISFRQMGKLSEAHRFLKNLYKNCLDDLERLDLVDSFLWLNVSVLDKLEMWAQLMDADEKYIASLFARLKVTLPEKIYQHLRTCYQSSMAIACFRMGKYDEAIIRAQESIEWECTPTADESLKIIGANAFVTHALCCIYQRRVNGGDSSLVNQAVDYLEVARTSLSDIIYSNEKKESHHLGRFYGTLAFTTIAQYDESGDKSELNKKEQQCLLNYAKRSHSPPEERTKFGRVAGLYCEAFSRFWLAKNCVDANNNHLNKALCALNEISELISKNQVKAKEKVNQLRAEIEKLTKGNVSEPRDYQWLALPIN